MSGTAVRFSVLRNAEERGGALAASGGETLSKDRNNLLSRAALFRLEADALRLRTSATDETVIRNQYFKLADRWSALAVGLELQVLALVTEPE
jgi:hypothetical protein